MGPSGVFELKLFSEGESMDSQKLDALGRELDLVMARAGVSVPPERKAGVVACYADLKRMTTLLRQPRSAATEPSNIFSLPIILRSA